MERRSVERRLSAILAADVVGYSRLVGEDEEATLAELAAQRIVIDRLIGQHRGRLFGSAGDSVIAEFRSPVEAVRAAVDVQLALHERTQERKSARSADGAGPDLRWRIGVNLGDVVVEGDDLLGDGVNVAARLEAMASPGGVCLSHTVVDHVRDHLELDLDDLGEQRLKNIARPVRAFRVPLVSEVQEVAPYRGLEAFDAGHASMFCGRARQVAATLERLQRQAGEGRAFLLIYGASGVGKSSLMRAGLLPALTRPGTVDGIESWRQAVFRPAAGATPLDALARALLEPGAWPELAADGLTPAALAQQFAEAEDELPVSVQGVVSRAAPLAPALALGVDQLEELLTVEGLSDDDRGAFVRALGALAASGRAWIAATMRSDFFHRCAEVPGLSALKDGFGSYELLAPSAADIGVMIREPARRAGLRFEARAEEGRLDDVIQQAAARDPAALPLLSFTLAALWEAGKEQRLLTFADYQALGGLEGAIARRADEVVTGLAEPVRDALPAVLRALVSVGLRDRTPTARAVPEPEIATSPERRALLEALAGARLLIRDEGAASTATLRLAHEALLSHWPRAREIVSANQAFLEARARLQVDLHRWLVESRNPELLLPPGRRLAEAEELLTAGADELEPDLRSYIQTSLDVARASGRKTLRRLQTFAAAMAVLAILAAIGGYLGYTGQQRAERQADLAERETTAARAAEQEAERQAVLAEQQAIAARAAEADAERQAQATAVARDEALAARSEALSNQSVYLTDLSRQQTASGNATNGILLALEALPNDMSNPNRPYVVGAEVALYGAMSARREIAVLHGHENSVLHVAFSPKGSRLVSSSSDGTARVWDVETGSELAVLRGHEGAVRVAAYSPDGGRIVTASADETARLWNAKDGAEMAILEGHDRSVRHARFSPDGRRIVTASDDGTALLWDAANTTRIAVLSGHTEGINAITFSNDGRYVATASNDATARLWDVSSGAEVAVLKGHENSVRDVAFSPDGTTLATASYDKTARLWDAGSGNEVMILRGHGLGVDAVAFSPDGSRVATASSDNTARLWEVSNGAVISVLEGHEGSVVAVGFSVEGEYVVTASRDGTARMWDAFDGAEIGVLRGHERAINHIASSPTADRSATASADGTVRIWDTGGLSGQTLLLRHRGGSGMDAVASAAFSPSGALVLTSSYDGTARVWDAVDGAVVAIFGGHRAPVSSAVFSPDERHVLTVAPDGKARLWEVRTAAQIAVLRLDYASPMERRDAQFLNLASFSPDGSRVVVAGGRTAGIWDVSTGEVIAVLSGHEGNINSAAFSPNGEHVLTSSYDHTARIWNAATGAETAVLVGHRLGTMGADFSRDGQLALTVSQDATARVWDVGSGSEIAVLRGHRRFIYQGAFSPDGIGIVTASGDGTARLWKIDGEVATVLEGHAGPVSQAAFSPDGSRVATASSDGTARLWDATTGSQVAMLEGHEAPGLNSVAFSPDGSRVITASGDGTARVFRVFSTTQALIDHARSIVPRQLTACERKRFFLPVENDPGSCPE